MTLEGNWVINFDTFPAWARYTLTKVRMPATFNEDGNDLTEEQRNTLFLCHDMIELINQGLLEVHFDGKSEPTFTTMKAGNKWKEEYEKRRLHKSYR